MPRPRQEAHQVPRQPERTPPRRGRPARHGPDDGRPQQRDHRDPAVEQGAHHGRQRGDLTRAARDTVRRQRDRDHHGHRGGRGTGRRAAPRAGHRPPTGAVSPPGRAGSAPAAWTAGRRRASGRRRPPAGGAGPSAGRPGGPRPRRRWLARPCPGTPGRQEVHHPAHPQDDRADREDDDDEADADRPAHTYSTATDRCGPTHGPVVPRVQFVIAPPPCGSCRLSSSAAPRPPLSQSPTVSTTIELRPAATARASSMSTPGPRAGPDGVPPGPPRGGRARAQHKDGQRDDGGGQEPGVHGPRRQGGQEEQCAERQAQRRADRRAPGPDGQSGGAQADQERGEHGRAGDDTREEGRCAVGRVGVVEHAQGRVTTGGRPNSAPPGRPGPRTRTEEQAGQPPSPRRHRRQVGGVARQGGDGHGREHQHGDGGQQGDAEDPRPGARRRVPPATSRRTSSARTPGCGRASPPPKSAGQAVVSVTSAKPGRGAPP